MNIRSDRMNKIEAVKEIMITGNSLAIFATRELKMLDLEKGNKVKVTFEKIN